MVLVHYLRQQFLTAQLIWVFFFQIKFVSPWLDWNHCDIMNVERALYHCARPVDDIGELTIFVEPIYKVTSLTLDLYSFIESMLVLYLWEEGGGVTV